MLKLHGKIHGTFVSKRGTSKSGDSFGGVDKVQILVSEPQEDGTHRDAFIDLKCENAAPFKQHEGKNVEVPVGVFAPAKGQIIFFMAGPPKVSA